MNITIYSKPNCGACDYTKMWLDNNGIEYEAINAYEDSEAMELIQEKGFMGFPVVSVNNLLDLYIESKNENKMMRTELKVAGQKNSQLKEEAERLRIKLREVNGDAED